MPDLRTILHEAAATPSGDLDVARTLRAGHRLRRRRRMAAAGTLCVALAVTATVITVARDTSSPRPPRPPVLTGLENVPAGWSDLPPPPDGLAGGAVAWTGQELLVWSGDDISQPGDGGTPSDDGFVFDPRASAWRQMADAPILGRESPASAWTGTELLVVGGYGPGSQTPSDGAAYNPRSDSWRKLPAAPVATDARFSVWTGRELMVWGATSTRARTSRAGAAYDPAENSWRRIADAPVDTGRANAVWTGTEVIAVGRDVDAPVECSGEPACTTSISAAYNPRDDTWRDLGPTGVSPFSATVLAVDDHVVAWDYGQSTAVLKHDIWRAGPNTPLRFSECFNRGAASTSHGLGLFCEQTVLYDAASGTWREISDSRSSGYLNVVAADDVFLIVGGELKKGDGRLYVFRPPPTTSQSCEPVPFGPEPSPREATDIIAVDTACDSAREVARQSEIAVGGSYLAAGFRCPKAAPDERPSRFVYQCTSGKAMVKFVSLPYPIPQEPVPADARIVAPLPVRLGVTDDFGKVVAVRDTEAGWEIDVDRVAMLSEHEADQAAAEHGATAEAGYYLVNDDPTTRTYTVAARCVVWGNISFGHPGTPERVTVDKWRMFLGTSRAKETLFHFTLDGDEVTGVEEQYRP